MGSITKVAVALFLVLATAFILQPYRPVIVSGESMSPTFQNGQLVFAVGLNRQPKRGDIVLVDKDGSTIIKRVTMVPGDRYLEGKPSRSVFWTIVSTAAGKKLAASGRMQSRVRTVPDGKIFIEGDNPGCSLDSRIFGLVSVSAIKGVVVPI